MAYGTGILASMKGRGEARWSLSEGNVRDRRIFSKSILGGVLCSFCGVEGGTVVLTVMLCLKAGSLLLVVIPSTPTCPREKCFDL